MKLSRFDGLCVQITDRFSDVYEGICCYHSSEYNEHEFGRNEEGVEIAHFLFFKSDISRIISLEDHTGPCGKFTSPFGKIETLTADDGIDSIRDVLLDEEDIHVFRLLLCIESRLSSGGDTIGREPLKEVLEELIDTTQDVEIRRKALQIKNLL